MKRPFPLRKFGFEYFLRSINLLKISIKLMKKWNKVADYVKLVMGGAFFRVGSPLVFLIILVI